MDDPRIERSEEDGATDSGHVIEEYHGVPEVELLLQEPLETENMSDLMKQMSRCEAWLGRVSFQWRNAQLMLSQLRKQFLIPKSKEYTDMDRTISLENSTRIIQCQADILRDQAEILRNRISLGQSLLSSHREELKRQIR